MMVMAEITQKCMELERTASQKKPLCVSHEIGNRDGAHYDKGSINYTVLWPDYVIL